MEGLEQHGLFQANVTGARRETSCGYSDTLAKLKSKSGMEGEEEALYKGPRKLFLESL
jgi:hypothetical protein